MKPRMVAPVCLVIMDDGSEFEVQSTNFDMLSYERYARAHKMPGANEAPMEAATFVAWHALRREGSIRDTVTYDEFTTTAVSIESRLAVVPPTQEDRGED